MKITFEQEGNSIFAVAQNVKYKGKMCDELLYCEIWLGTLPFSVGIRWEDDYNKPVNADTIEEAKQHILDNYSSHKPHINGKSYDIDED
jgi:hypothetical protein